MSSLSPLFHSFSKKQTCQCKILHIYPAHPSPLHFAALWWTVHDSLEYRLAVESMMRKRKRFELFHFTENENFAHRDVCRKAFCGHCNTSNFFTNTWETQKKRTPSCKRERKRERETPRLNSFIGLLFSLCKYAFFIIYFIIYIYIKKKSSDFVPHRAVTTIYTGGNWKTLSHYPAVDSATVFVYFRYKCCTIIQTAIVIWPCAFT